MTQPADLATPPKSSQAHHFFEQIGPALVTLRERAGMSAAAVARKARVGKSQLSKYENGKEAPKLSSLERILDALNIEPLVFFYYVHVASQGFEDERLKIELMLIESRRRVGGVKVLANLLELHRGLLECLAPVEAD
jgi:transcriptional regulator with XRE-family HTH domain